MKDDYRQYVRKYYIIETQNMLCDLMQTVNCNANCKNYNAFTMYCFNQHLDVRQAECQTCTEFHNTNDFVQYSIVGLLILFIHGRVKTLCSLIQIHALNDALIRLYI